MIDISNEAVLNVVRYNMGLRPGESVLVMSDVPSQKDWVGPEAKLRKLIDRAHFARKVHAILCEHLHGHKIDYACYPSTGMSGTEPPKDTAELLLQYDVILLMTTHSLSHTDAREEASRLGHRIASMPGIEPGMFTPYGPMAADYAQVEKDCLRIAAVLDAGSDARVTTPLGTDLRFSIAGRKGGPDTGVYRDTGDWGNLPGGETFAAPLEGTAQGALVVGAGWYPGLAENMTLTFADGLVTDVKGGGAVGDDFRRLLFSPDSPAHRRNCAELGVGTNPNAKRVDNTLEAEKIKGTVHIAIGDSSHLGGVTPSDLHADFVLEHPSLYIDGELVAL